MKTFCFVSVVALGLFGLVIRFNAALAEDCPTPVTTCGWHNDPTQIQALSSGLFADDVTWAWHIQGNHDDTGVVFVEWDDMDVDDDGVEDVVLDPAYILWYNSLCTDTFVSTLSGNLEVPAESGVVVIQGNVAHHTTQLCVMDKNITVLAAQ